MIRGLARQIASPSRVRVSQRRSDAPSLSRPTEDAEGGNSTWPAHPENVD